MPVLYSPFISRQNLRDHRDQLFVFGDNLTRRGLGGQAKQMRGEPNAVGLVTKLSISSFLRPGLLEEVELHSANEIQRLKSHHAQGGIIVWPQAGIGTGLAQLAQQAPNIAEYWDRLLLWLDPASQATILPRWSQR